MKYQSQAVAKPYFIAAIGLFVGQILCFLQGHDACLFTVRANDPDLRCSYIFIAPRFFTSCDV